MNTNPDQSNPMAEQRTLDAEREFEAWWESDGQYIRAGGGQYEKSFAYAAWLAARRAPPALDAVGLPELPKPVRMSADQAYLGYTAEQVRQAMRDAVAADRRSRVSADQWASLDAARVQLEAAKVERENRVARQSAPEGAPAGMEAVGRIIADDPVHGWHMEALKPWNEIGSGTMLYAPTSASAQPADQNKMENNDE